MIRVNLTRQLRTLLTAMLSLATVTMVYVFGFQPIHAKSASIEHDLTQAERLLTKYRALLQEKKSVISRYQAVEKTDLASSGYESEADIMGDLQQLSSGLVDITGMRPVRDGSSSDFRFGLEFDCEGGLRDLVELLYRIDKGSSALSIMALNLSAGAEPATVKAHAYVQAGN